MQSGAFLPTVQYIEKNMQIDTVEFITLEVAGIESKFKTFVWQEQSF